MVETLGAVEDQERLLCWPEGYLRLVVAWRRALAQTTVDGMAWEPAPKTADEPRARVTIR